MFDNSFSSTPVATPVESLSRLPLPECPTEDEPQAVLMLTDDISPSVVLDTTLGNKHYSTYVFDSSFELMCECDRLWEETFAMPLVVVRIKDFKRLQKEITNIRKNKQRIGCKRLFAIVPLMVVSCGFELHERIELLTHSGIDTLIDYPVEKEVLRAQISALLRRFNS